MVAHETLPGGPTCHERPLPPSSGGRGGANTCGGVPSPLPSSRRASAWYRAPVGGTHLGRAELAHDVIDAYNVRMEDVDRGREWSIDLPATFVHAVENGCAVWA